MLMEKHIVIHLTGNITKVCYNDKLKRNGKSLFS
jgi:hypothetical protein